MNSYKGEGLDNKITAAKKANNTIGKIDFLYSGESMRFTDAAEMLKAYKECINIYGVSGINVKVMDGNPDLAYEICVIQYGEFGEEPPTKEEFYLKYNNFVKEDINAR